MGTITGISYFTDTSSNSGICKIAEFLDDSTNNGTVIETASFVNNSINLSDVIGTATFSASAKNIGTVQGVVVFSGEATNDGIVQEAVFLDQSKNLGTVQLTATFSGTSRNEGNVQNAVFVENTTTNIGTVVSNALVPVGFVNAGTIAVSSSYSQLSGAYSYGYFDNTGNKSAPPSYETVAYDVGGIWYKYDANGNAVIANGNYSDGSNDRVFRNGIKLDIGTVIINNTQYYYELPLEQSKTIYTSSNLSTKATKLSGAGWGVYIDGNDVEDEWTITPSGVLTWTNVPRNGAYVEGYYFNNGISTAYNNNTPQVAKNRDNSYFVYSLGLPTSADGAYTNGYYLQGLLSGTFVAPQSAKDNNSSWYLYTTGAPSVPTGAYSNGYYSSGSRTGTYTTPQTAIDDQLYYSYAEGVATKASGSYTTGFFANGALNPSYTNNTPAFTVNANYYIVYTGGVPASADGYYSNGVYAQGAPFSFSSLIPYQAIDSEKWYIYTTGVVTATANGPYSTGYFVNGDRDNYYTNATSQVAVDDGLRYIYSNGVPAVVLDGAYSDGYFVNSQLSGTFVTPQPATDKPNNWYTYTNGVATSANGAYTVGYFINSVKTGNYSAPQTAIDQPDSWYIYTDGVSTSATGAYSTGYFLSGVAVSTLIVPQSAKDQVNQYYIYQNSKAINTLSAVWVQLGNIIGPTAALQTIGNGIAVNSTGSKVVFGGNSANGFVRVYQLSTTSVSSSWIQQGSDITGEASGDSFGNYTNVAMNSAGDRWIAGGTNNDGAGSNAGHARVYQLSTVGSSYTWVQLGQDIDGQAANYNEGRGTAMNSTGDIIATGAYRAFSTERGSVRVFQLSTVNNVPTWTQLGSTLSGGSYQQMGYSVSLNAAGNRVATGGPSDSTTFAYVWEFNGTEWSLLTSIRGEESSDQFGLSVALNETGDRLAVGAYANNAGVYSDIGSVRVFQNTGSSWVKMGQDIDGEANTDYSGYSVDLNSTGDYVIIGATQNDGLSASIPNANSGHARVYGWTGTSWVKIGNDIDHPRAGAKLGTSVALNSMGDRAFASAQFDPTYGTLAGSVQAYQLSG